MSNTYTVEYIRSALDGKALQPPDSSKAGKFTEICYSLYTVAQAGGGVDAIRTAWETAKRLNADAAKLDVDASKKPRWEIIHYSDLDTLPPVSWLVEDIITEKGLNVIYGPSGSGKSFYALHLSAGLSARENVLYVVGEGVYGYRGRITAWKDHHGKTPRGFYLTTGAIAVMDVSDLTSFIEAARELKPTLVIVDTVARAMVGSDENSTRDMGLFIQACNDIQRELDTTILLIHHTGKAGSVERGSSALRAAADVMVYIHMEDEVIKVESSKVKDRPPFEPRYYRLMNKAFEFDGRIENFAVVVPADRVRQTADDPLSQTQRKIVESLAMATMEDGASMAEITEIHDIPRATLHRALTELIKLKFVYKPNRGQYKLTEAGLGLIESEDSGDGS